MLKNYFITAWRNLWKNKAFSAINIAGLATGLATCLLITLYVLNELSFDQYNTHANRIYRINNEVKLGENHFDLAQSPPLLGPAMVQELPQVEQYTRFRWHGSIRIKKGNELLREKKVVFADSTLFEVFTLPMISGDPKTALAAPYSMVLTESAARRYFNRTDVAGQSLFINDKTNYKIGGVIKDIPVNSHFNYDFFIALSEDKDSYDEMSWMSQNYNTYVLLKPGADPKKVIAEADKLLERRVEPVLKDDINLSLDQFKKEGGFTRISLTPLMDIHLRANKMGELSANGSITYVYIFAAIAIFILLIACVNFMNLSTARSANRAKEVGVRKVLGSVRKNLITQFLAESLLVSFISMLLALLLTWLLLPFFNTLAGTAIGAGLLFRPGMLGALAGLVLLVGLLAGSYPAFFLSAFQPIEVLKGKIAKGFKGSWLRNSLVVFQFSISIILITGTLVIYNQLMYLHNRDVGYNREQVLLIKNTNVLNTQVSTFKNELLALSGVKNATLSGYLPMEGDRHSSAFFPSPTLDQKSTVIMQRWMVDETYLPTLDIKVLKGRNFSPRFLTDSTAILINEAAAKFLGTDELLNKQLYRVENNETKKVITYHIIGVIKNFNFNSLRDEITPLALCLGRSTGNIAVRVNSTNMPALVAQVKQKWQAMAPAEPFTYSFMNEDFNNQFHAEQRTGTIFIAFATLAIFIACLGLFGLVTFAAEQRVKEIGVRKVLGATAANIVTMLSKDFLKLVLVANIIAWPAAWWVMNNWLQDFAYRTPLSWWIFAIAGIAAALIALLTVSFQAIKAALANPVTSLRSE